MPQSLLDRLTDQIAASGKSRELARNIAIKTLRGRGHMKPDSEELTSEGRYRESLGAAGRAMDRAAKGTNSSMFEFNYNPLTNKGYK